MVKKALKVVVTLGLLFGAYTGYVQVFAHFATRVHRQTATALPAFVAKPAKTDVRSTELAKESFGAGHWAADPKLRIRWYDAARGYYLYAGDYKRKGDGRQMECFPFALIWLSKDGKTRKIAAADRAVIDFDKPLGILKPGASSGASKVVHARLENNVLLRDDKGTPDNPKDDLQIRNLTYIEYDDEKRQISSTSDILLVDRDMTIEGTDLMIQLRARVPGQPVGYDAETVFLRKNVHVVVKNAGRSGIMPGKAVKTTSTGETPVDLRCKGEMRIDLPPSRDKKKPDAPVLPTIISFERNIEVLRGVERPDELHCDTLELTLAPPDMAAAARKVADKDPKTEGPLSDLTLREARAKGHNVWLVSQQQGVKARCNELIHKKFGATPDETYLRGDSTNNLWVEKVELEEEGPNAGKIKSFLTIRAMDAKIFEDGSGGQSSTVVARGPGLLEGRTAPNTPVERSAWWQDELILRTEAVAANLNAGIAKPVIALDAQAKAKAPTTLTRRIITLSGKPRLVDHTRQFTLDARKSVVVKMRPEGPGSDEPKQKAAEKGSTSAPALAAAPRSDKDGKPAKADKPAGPDSSKIETLYAFEDVKLVSPGRNMNARNELTVVFEEPQPGQVAIIPKAPARTSPPSPETTTTRIAAKPVAEDPKAATDKATAKADPKAKAKKDEPPVLVEANRIWAKIASASESTDKGEFREARLRGRVKFHQDPEKGKARGTDVAGEALDVINRGDGRMQFKVFNLDPSASQPQTQLAALGAPPQGVQPVATLAVVETDDMKIEGPVIGFDQLADFAFVQGPGSMIQMAERGLLSDKGLASETKNGKTVAVLDATGKPKASTKIPMKIQWTGMMRFFGKAKDPFGNEVAKTEFRGLPLDKDGKPGVYGPGAPAGVRAVTTDSLIICDDLDVYMDKVVSLNQPRTKAGGVRTVGLNPDDVAPEADAVATADAEKKPAEPRPEIAYVDAIGRSVVVINEKKDEATGIVVEKQRIDAQRVTYDRRTGVFNGLAGSAIAKGAGMVYLWNRKPKDKDKAKDKPADAASPAAGLNLGTGRKAGFTPSPTDVIELTQIKFGEWMKGRFGIGKDRPEAEPREAEMNGQVQVLHANVSDVSRAINPESESGERVYLTADQVKVVSLPNPADPKAPARQMLNARGTAQARTNSHTVQGDQITYDSGNELFYVYGLDGREISIVDQSQPGQPVQTVRGTSGWFNRVTRQSNVMDPSHVAFFDPKTGQRAPNGQIQTGSPDGKPVPFKPTRSPIKNPTRNQPERRGYSGGQ